MGRVSLVGALLARPGAEFTFAKPCDVASSCPVAATCQNLELGRAYRVVSTRPIRHSVCTEHEGGVQAVEVEPAPLAANVPDKMLRGTLIRWEVPVCNQRGCPNWNGCFENHLAPATQYEVKQVGAPVACAMGYSLKAVKLADA